MEGGGIRKAAWMGGEGGGGRSRSRREKEGRRKWAMTCSVISVLCIRPRLIYREPRRGTGCAPGAHPGPSHASALPPILFRPLRPSSDFASSLRFLFAPVFPPLIPTGWRKRALHFLFFLSRPSLSFSFVPSVPPRSSLCVSLRLFNSQWSFRGQHRTSIGNLSLAKTFRGLPNISDRRDVTRNVILTLEPSFRS